MINNDIIQEKLKLAIDNFRTVLLSIIEYSLKLRLDFIEVSKTYGLVNSEIILRDFLTVKLKYPRQLYKLHFINNELNNSNFVKDNKIAIINWDAFKDINDKDYISEFLNYDFLSGPKIIVINLIGSVTNKEILYDFFIKEIEKQFDKSKTEDFDLLPFLIIVE
jgi:hypothetical protein